MFPARRRLAIVEQIRAAQVVRADDLARQFEVSVETVRRDLKSLEMQGLLERVYGGAAKLRVGVAEASFDQRRLLGAGEKRAIGAAAAARVGADETILIDVGTTALEVARALPPTWQGRVLTNSVLVAVELAGRTGIELLLSGGRVRSGDLACSGPHARSLFDDFFVAKAFLGSGGVHPTGGLTDYYSDEAALRRAALARVGQSFVLADSSKLGQIAPCRVCDLDRIDSIVTGADADADMVAALRDRGPEVIVAPDGGRLPAAAVLGKSVR
ncbi:MAG: DeoR/GlpR family DNA-binding transcription regulator [Actinomycetota bacterium]|nr:DeoR/GlpR family DNA-binding transcription regulator [Actinomycetota bacterium]